MLSGDAFLPGLDQIILKLEDVPTVLTDQVIVVLTGFDGFIACLTIPEVTFMGDARIGEQLHGAVDRGVAYPAESGLDVFDEFFDREVSFTVEKSFQDGASLSGILEVVAIEVFFKLFGERVVISIRTSRHKHMIARSRRMSPPEPGVH